MFRGNGDRLTCRGDSFPRNEKLADVRWQLVGDMNSTPGAADSELALLREKWEPAWRVWRARRLDGRRTGDYVASRMEDAAGVDPTIIEPTAAGLDAALTEQAERAALTTPRRRM